MKPKNAGISLIIALVTSFFLLGVTLEVLRLAGVSLERAQFLTRGNQVFYAAESGLEAAFFHHNARGQGVDFGSLDDAGNAQMISVLDDTISVEWTVDGRSASSDPSTGVLHEYETVQIPLFWDGAADPTEEINLIDIENNHLEVMFDTPSTDILLPGGVDRVMVTWELKKIEKDAGENIKEITTFVPTSTAVEDPCEGSFPVGHSFFCASDLNAGNKSFQSTDALPGKVLPGEVETDLLDFYDAISGYEYVLTLRSVGGLDAASGVDKIQSLHFSVDTVTAQGDLPLPEYQAKARVSTGDFQKTIAVTIPERAVMGVFDSVIFD
ncbi:MAG: hypothetical protein K9M51_00615 [Candidatus Gracilibacteria bacterium]|nr:hypothetical protein [Candidatus Gracilibacteria bacterium]